MRTTTATAKKRRKITGRPFYVRIAGRRVLWAVEEAPRVRTIILDGEPVRLSFPYVIFTRCYVYDRLVSGRVFFRNSPVEDIYKDKGFTPPLPHIDMTGRVCMPRHCVYLAEFQRSFWQSAFRSDHMNSYHHGHKPLRILWKTIKGDVIRPRPFFQPEGWEKLTTDNPAAILEFNWDIESRFRKYPAANNHRALFDESGG